MNLPPPISHHLFCVRKEPEKHQFELMEVLKQSCTVVFRKTFLQASVKDHTVAEILVYQSWVPQFRVTNIPKNLMLGKADMALLLHLH